MQNSNAEATSVQTFAPKVSHTEILGSLGVYCVGYFTRTGVCMAWPWGNEY